MRPKEMEKNLEENGGTPAACNTCGDKDCSAAKRKNGESDQDFADRRALESRLCRIQRKIVVLSGKGGVGKSTVAANIAVALQMAGKRVGLLDVDIHGPSIPTMLGLEGETLQGGADGLLPVDLEGLKVMSLGFLLPDPDQAVIWRGPLKMGAIKQFLKDVAWGDLDYLIIDSPPGTGDEPLSVMPADRQSGRSDRRDHAAESGGGGCAQVDHLLPPAQCPGARRGGEHERLRLPEVRRDLCRLQRRWRKTDRC